MFRADRFGGCLRGLSRDELLSVREDATGNLDEELDSRVVLLLPNL